MQLSSKRLFAFTTRVFYMWASGIEIRHIKQSFIYTACLKVMVAHHLDVPLVSNLVSSFENSATVRKN